MMSRVGDAASVVVRSAGVPHGYEDSNSRHYRCCCGRSHVRAGTQHIVVVQLAAGLLNVLSAAVWTHWLQLPLLFVWIAVLAIALYSVYKYSALGLVPLIVLQGLCTVVLLVGAMFTIGVMAGADFLSKYHDGDGSGGNSTNSAGAASDKVDDGKASIHALSAVLLVVCLLLAAVYIWFITVYYGCFKYFQARAHYLRLAAAGGADFGRR